MEFAGEGEKQREDVRACMACTRFGILPAAPAVDATGRSQDEADKLCRTHRWRVLRGYCFLCGVGTLWASPFGDASIGCCRKCLIAHHGINQARKIEVALDESGEEAGEGGKGPWETN